MTTTITRGEVRAVLQAWQRDELTARKVHDWAEDRYAASAFEPEDEVVNEVLAKLDTLDMNLTTTADVPALLTALEQPPAEMQDTIAALERYFDSVNIAARIIQCAADPLYAPFCVTAEHRDRRS